MMEYNLCDSYSIPIIRQADIYSLAEQTGQIKNGRIKLVRTSSLSKCKTSFFFQNPKNSDIIKLWKIKNQIRTKIQNRRAVQKAVPTSQKQAA